MKMGTLNLEKITRGNYSEKVRRDWIRRMMHTFLRLAESIQGHFPQHRLQNILTHVGNVGSLSTQIIQSLQWGHHIRTMLLLIFHLVDYIFLHMAPGDFPELCLLGTCKCICLVFGIFDYQDRARARGEAEAEAERRSYEMRFKSTMRFVPDSHSFFSFLHSSSPFFNMTHRFPSSRRNTQKSWALKIKAGWDIISISSRTVQ